MVKIGIDLGGTKIEGIAIDISGKELIRKRIPTEKEKGYTHILNNIHSLYKHICRETGNKPHTFGIGTPGSLSIKTGLLKGSNTVCMNGMPVKEDLEKLLGRKIAIQNDANCFAEAEALLGAGKGKDLVFGVIMGTGCGGGIVYKGEVMTGLQAIGGEWGHMTIDPNGPRCYCGKNGCTEVFISGGGLEKRWIEKHQTKRLLKDIEQDFYKGDAAAAEFFRIFFDNFGRSMSNLINILDPDIIVLGGGVSNFKAIYTEGIEAVRKYVFSDTLETPIVQHKLGDSAGVIGAALIGI